MKKSTATDQYRLSYGPAKFDAAMARFDAKIRQAITRSNLDRCHHIMHLNVADNIIYHFSRRNLDKQQRELL